MVLVAAAVAVALGVSGSSSGHGAGSAAGYTSGRASVSSGPTTSSSTTGFPTSTSALPTSPSPSSSSASPGLRRGRILLANVAQTDPEHRVPADVPVPLFPSPPTYRVARRSPPGTQCGPAIEPGVEYDFPASKHSGGLNAVLAFGAYLQKHGWVKSSFSLDMGMSGGGMAWFREDGTQVIDVEESIPLNGGQSMFTYTWNRTRPGSGQQKLGRVLKAGVAQTDGTGHLPASVPVPAVGCTFEAYHLDRYWHLGRWPDNSYDAVSRRSTGAYVKYLRAHGWSYRVTRNLGGGNKEVELTKGSQTIYWDVTNTAPALWHYHG